MIQFNLMQNVDMLQFAEENVRMQGLLQHREKIAVLEDLYRETAFCTMDQVP